MKQSDNNRSLLFQGADGPWWPASVHKTTITCSKQSTTASTWSSAFRSPTSPFLLGSFQTRISMKLLQRKVSSVSFWKTMRQLQTEINNRPIVSMELRWYTGYTVEPRYLEQNRISLGFALVFQSFTMGYLDLGYLEHPAISNCFSLPLAQINPGYLELYYVPKKHWSKSVRKCSQGTSWQDVLKAEKCIDVFTVTKATSNWLDLLLRMQNAKSCRYLLILGIKLLLQKFDANLAISNPRYLELFLETLERSR